MSSYDHENFMDAPWFYDKIAGQWVITDKFGFSVADTNNEFQAKRIKQLPNLYAALEEAARFKCAECLHAAYCSGELRYSDSFDIIKDGCPFNYEDYPCIVVKWLETLKKVRETK